MLSKQTYLLALVMGIICSLLFAHAARDLNKLELASYEGGYTESFTNVALTASSVEPLTTTSVTLAFTPVDTVAVGTKLSIALPGYQGYASISRARIVRPQNGEQQQIVQTWTKLLSSVSTLLNPYTTPKPNANAEVIAIVPVTYALEAGVNYTVEVDRLVAPSIFNIGNDCIAASDLTVQSGPCCERYTISVLTQSNEIISHDAAATCPARHQPLVAPTQCHDDTVEFALFSCCQYDDLKDDARCVDPICLIDDAQDKPFDTKCCNTPGLKSAEHSQCAQCTYGNWSYNYCCDTDMSFREVDERCDLVVCNCDEWTPERCCHKFTHSAWYQSDLCPSCEEKWDAETCCLADSYLDDPRCVCTGDNYDLTICCASPEFYDEDECREACVEEPSEFTPEVCCRYDGFDTDPSCLHECELNPCACNPCAPECENPCGCASHYESHELHATEIHSGANTVIINHLTINAVIDGDALVEAVGTDSEALEDAVKHIIMPSIVLNVGNDTGDAEPCNGNEEEEPTGTPGSPGEEVVSGEEEPTGTPTTPEEPTEEPTNGGIDLTTPVILSQSIRLYGMSFLFKQAQLDIINNLYQVALSPLFPLTKLKVTVSAQHLEPTTVIGSITRTDVIVTITVEFHNVVLEAAMNAFNAVTEPITKSLRDVLGAFGFTFDFVTSDISIINPSILASCDGCGDGCNGCRVGETCETNDDCLSAICEELVCAEVSDGKNNDDDPSSTFSAFQSTYSHLFAVLGLACGVIAIFIQ